MNNVPVIKIGIVAVSRDCFPESLAVNRRKLTKDESTLDFISIYAYIAVIIIISMWFLM